MSEPMLNMLNTNGKKKSVSGGEGFETVIHF